MTYLVNGIEFSSEELGEFLYDYIIKNDIDRGDLHSILSVFSLSENIKLQPMGIARELGFEVTVLR